MSNRIKPESFTWPVKQSAKAYSIQIIFRSFDDALSWMAQENIIDTSDALSRAELQVRSEKAAKDKQDSKFLNGIRRWMGKQ